MFKTRIYHPNISLPGHICMDIFFDDWTPTLTISKVLLAISDLLVNLNPYNFINTDAYWLYKEDPNKYEQVVREYTIKYASK